MAREVMQVSRHEHGVVRGACGLAIRRLLLWCSHKNHLHSCSCCWWGSKAHCQRAIWAWGCCYTIHSRFHCE